ncbi:ATP-binding protein [Neobacillus sp. D3-1R]|uniref:ATP-binding protein n=1 Tax=Neobacillus sp. D3-1R TaxID=3445778 RepID=UPI003FA11751
MIDENRYVDYSLLVEQSSNGIVVIDQNTKIHYANQSCLSLFDCTMQDFIQSDFSHFIIPEFKEIFKDEIHQLLSHKVPCKYTYQVRSSLGQLMYAEIKMAPHYSKKEYISLFIRELPMHQSTQPIAHFDKIASIKQLTAGIVHEVRNPLSAVKGFLHLLKEENNPKYLHTMEVELDKALSTLNNLLHVTKPDFQDEPSFPINLCQELDSIAYLFHERLFNIKIEKNYADEAVMIVGKRNLLIKAFFNLIKNAIEAIKTHGKIIIKQYVEDSMVHIKITDNGVGIPDESLTMLGTPFFSTKMDGTGMGLTQVFTTIHNHNGRVSIESEVGKGTTFHICLPIR